MVKIRKIGSARSFCDSVMGSSVSIQDDHFALSRGAKAERDRAPGGRDKVPTPSGARREAKVL